MESLLEGPKTQIPHQFSTPRPRMINKSRFSDLEDVPKAHATRRTVGNVAEVTNQQAEVGEAGDGVG